jgi:signal transduction histidine kinase
MTDRSGAADAGGPLPAPPAAGSGGSDGGWRRDRLSHGRTRPALALAVLVALVQMGATALLGGPGDVRGYALLGAGGLALALRRRLPVVTVLAVAAATVAYHSLGYAHTFTTFLAAVIAGVATTKAGHPHAVRATIVLAYVAWVFLAGVPLAEAVRIAAWGFGIALLLFVVANIFRMVGKLAKEQQRLHEERRRRQASEERLRIATELHDVLGHHLSLINVRAGVGLHLMDRQPEQARAALNTIRDASAEALREVRSVLDALYPSGKGAPRAPAPGLDRLAELTADAGLPVHTSIGGRPRELPAEIDRAAYRIVQEALTNVRRHAGPGASATVIIEYREDSLSVQVDDDGRDPAALGEGSGIGGMRERAAALGGTLSAGPLLDGGWRVRADLPVPPSTVDGAA